MKKYFILVIILLGIITGGILYSFNNDIEAKEDIKEKEIVEDISKKNNKEASKEITKIKIDVKGEVINPGVYEVDEKSRVIDQTTPNMIQKLNLLFARKPLISKEI